MNEWMTAWTTRDTKQAKFSIHGKILNTKFNISMSSKRKPVMNGSVLGTSRLDDSDCLRSGILQAKAEFLVSVSAVEGIPSPWLLLWMLISMKSTLFRISSANLLKCKECSECSLILEEQTLKRKGCANHLRLFRVSCGWVKDSITYLKVPNQRCFEVNSRLVYGMW